MAGITQGSNFPDYGGNHVANTNHVANFLYRLVFGPMSYPGDGSPHALVESFNPTTKAGFLNLASMFAGGPKGEDILNSEMPGQFEAYSMGKAAVGGHMGHDLAPDAWMEAVRAGHRQQAHDLLFGGTVHAKGAIPNRPAFNEPPKDAAAAIAQKLGISPAKVRAQMEAAEKAQANAAREQAIARVLHNHGMANHDPKGQPEFVQHIDHVTKTDQMPAQARAYAGHTVSVGKTGLEHGIFDLIAGGTKQLRQAQLRKILAQQLLNHRN